MATDKRIYEISLSSITQNGATCKNPTITWEKPECANVRCGVVDGKTLTVEIPEDCPDPCLYVIIDCTDDCALCEPERIKICPCTLNSDCPNCEDCVGNICISKCEAGQFCSEDGICSDCDNTHPCPFNQICVNGDCQCPPSHPYMDNKGNCSDCDSNHPCPPCFVCTPNGCVPKDCENCDPVTGECKECLTNTDCTGANECCIGDSCACCPGYILDVTTGNCIPQPDCIRDTDCSECQNCVDGGCVEVTCPTGYIRIPGVPCCVKECDCEDPSCPRSENCMRLDQDNCYCAPCSGACDSNGDCGEGCYCNGAQCVPNPCAGACNDGFDCGEGCGCDNGQCVPCASLDCSTNECRDVSGCNCTGNDCVKKECGGDCNSVTDCPPGCACFGGECVKCEDLECDVCKFAAGCDCIGEEVCIYSPCANNCKDGDDCPGVDCGCDKSKESCVSCESYSCENGEICPDGCICKENGTCGGNPCNSTYCSNDSDCGQNCHCVDGMCNPCPSNDPNCGNYSGCSDLLTVTKIDDTCDLQATLTSNECCECEDISAGLKLNNVTADGSKHFQFTGELQLRGGGQSATWAIFTGKQFLRDFIDEVLPISGKFDVILEEEYGGPAGLFLDRRVVTVDMTNTDEYTVLNTPKIEFKQVAVPGQIYFVGGSNRTHIKTTIKLVSKTDIVLENGCSFSLNEAKVVSIPNDISGMGMMTSLSSYSTSFELVKNILCKKQKLSWYRNDTPTLTGATNFKNVWMDFVSNVGNSKVHTNVLTTVADGLIYGKYYWALPGCSCWLSFVPYSCYGHNGVPTKLTFDSLKPSEFNFSVSECCKKVTFEEVKVRCDIMTAASPGVKYVLYINGVATATEYTLLNTGVLIPNGTTYTHTGVINSVGLKIKDDVCGTSLVTKSATCLPFEMDFDFIVDTCYTSGDISVLIPTTNAGTGSKSYSIDNGSDPAVTGTFLGSSITVPNVPAISGDYTVTVTLTDGCEVEVIKSLDLDGYNAATKLLVDTGCSGSSGYLRATNNYNEIAVIDVDSVINYVPANGVNTVTVPTNTPFTYDFYVQSTPSCHVTEVGKVVVCCEDLDVNDLQVNDQVCNSDTEVGMTLDNTGSVSAVFSFENENGVSLGPDVTVLAGGSVPNTVTINGDYVLTKVRAALAPNCVKTIIDTFDTTTCADFLLDQIVVSYQCVAGNGGNGQANLTITNNTSPAISYQAYVNNALVYTGSSNYTWTNIPQPSTYNVKIVIAGGEKTTTLNIDCRV